MKIIDDYGNEHVVSGEAQARRIIRDAFRPFYGPRQNFNYGPHKGRHVAKTKAGRWQYKYIELGKIHLGPTRATEAEALEDYRRVQNGEALAPKAPLKFSAEVRARMSAARKARYEADRAASPDGQVHIPPPTCSACGEIGHKKNACPKSGFVRRVYVPKTGKRRVHRCSFCQSMNHHVQTCPVRRDAIAARIKRAA